MNNVPLSQMPYIADELQLPLTKNFMRDIIDQGGQYSPVNIVLGGHYSLVNNVRGDNFWGGIIFTITLPLSLDTCYMLLLSWIGVICCNPISVSEAILLIKLGKLHCYNDIGTQKATNVVLYAKLQNVNCCRYQLTLPVT